MRYLARNERVGFDLLRDEHAELYARWVNDPEVKVGLLNAGLYSAGDERAGLVSATQRLAAQREPTAAGFTIFDLADDRPVGTLGLFDVSWRHRRCELGVLVGERRGQGLGTHACRLAIDWAFNVWSLNSVYLEAIAFNERAVRAYERAGFRRIGVRRETTLVRGALHDEVLMDALASEFEGPSYVTASEI